MNRFYSACLLTIVLLLAIIALRPMMTPQPAIAAERYTYLVSSNAQPIETELNTRAAEGWEFATAVWNNQGSGLVLIFRKPAP